MQDMHTKVNEMSKQINGIHYQHDLELQQKLMVRYLWNLLCLGFKNMFCRILSNTGKRR